MEIRGAHAGGGAVVIRGADGSRYEAKASEGRFSATVPAGVYDVGGRTVAGVPGDVVRIGSVAVRETPGRYQARTGEPARRLPGPGRAGQGLGLRGR